VIEALKFTKQLKNGNNVQIPALYNNTFTKNDHVRAILLREEPEDKSRISVTVKALLNEDDAVDDIYETLRNKQHNWYCRHCLCRNAFF